MYTEGEDASERVERIDSLVMKKPRKGEFVSETIGVYTQHERINGCVSRRVYTYTVLIHIYTDASHNNHSPIEAHTERSP